jgi:circadian clock protein KaiC
LRELDDPTVDRPVASSATGAEDSVMRTMQRTAADRHSTPPAPDERSHELPKAPTGISGLDGVTGGGLPKGRPTLVCGPAGCGKTLLALEFLVRGITEFDEPGVFVAFEESADDLIANVSSMGFDLVRHVDDSMLVLDHIEVAGRAMEETGEWDLDGLLIRLGAAIDAVGAKRLVIDTIEVLFGAFSDTATLRAELRRLFTWLKDRGVTAVITANGATGR